MISSRPCLIKHFLSTFDESTCLILVRKHLEILEKAREHFSSVTTVRVFGLNPTFLEKILRFTNDLRLES